MTEEKQNEFIQALKEATEKQEKENEIASRVGPLTPTEFTELKTHLEGIKNYLPEHLMGTFWNFYNRIRGVKEKQPCSCRTSAGHWSRCVEELRKFVRERSE